MKYKTKIDTPWCKKGIIFREYNEDGSRKWGPECILDGVPMHLCDHPIDYPDFFEKVEEKRLTPLGKWVRIFERVKNGNAWENLAYKLSIQYPIDVDKIYKEVCGEG